MRQFSLLIFCLFCAILLDGQNIQLQKEEITPDGISKIGGMAYYNNQLYLLLQTNLLFNGKELEASEALKLSQKYPVWEIYSFNEETRTIKNESDKWSTPGALPFGFSIIDDSSVVYIGNRQKLSSNNKLLNNSFKSINKLKVEFSDPSIINDNQRLMFSANINKEGGSNIWIADKLNDEWTEPSLLLSNIGTPSNVISPSTYKDSLLIYSQQKDDLNYDLSLYDLKKQQYVFQDSTHDINEYFACIAGKDKMYYLSGDKGKMSLWKAAMIDRSPIIETIDTDSVLVIKDAERPMGDLATVTTRKIEKDDTNVQMTNYFGVARYDLTPTMKDSLLKLSKVLKETPDLSILICGHASPDGPESLNMMLSYYRATEAYNFLLNQNISDTRLYRVYAGEYLYDNANQARNFSIFTVENIELPTQIAILPYQQNQRDALVKQYGTDVDDQDYYRDQLAQHLPVKTKALMYVPVSILYLAKPGESIDEIARKYNTPPAQMKKLNGISSNVINADQLILIRY